MNDGTIQNGAAHGGGSRRRSWESTFADFDLLRREIHSRIDGDKLTVVLMCRTERCFTKPDRTLDDRTKNRLNIGRRASDYPEDVARRGLLIQRFREVAVALLQFLEQPHVLDGDDSLLRKGLE